jgi:S-adenosylmethionine hydrolase
MTLRDYFAAKSMQAMETRSASGTYHGRAIQAYAQADAMLKAREE